VTLKVRLAAMMIVLLGAVMAAQYLLLQREQRVLASRLEALTQYVDDSTRFLANHTRRQMAEPPGELRELLDRLPAGATADSDSVSVVVIVHGDTLVTTEQVLAERAAASDGAVSGAGPSGDGETPIARRRPFPPRGERDEVEAELARFVAEARAAAGSACAVPDSGTIRLTAASFVQRDDGDSATVRLLFLGTQGGPGEQFEVIAREEALPAGMLKVNVPWLSDDGGPGHVELLYSTEGLTEELDRARRRSGLWLTGLLGVGAAAAVLVAAQFTRPIRSLQESFVRVQGGDLGVEVRPERPDEIGKLTESFNGMVARLRETREMERRLAESEHLAGLGTLAAGVAHEVRNPLNAMLLTLEQLRKNTAPPEGTEERARFDRYVRNVTSELTRLERLVGTVLDLSRDEAMARDSVDVSGSLGAAVELFSPEAAGRDVMLTAEVEDALRVRGDAERLRTVWNNLIANALQAAPDGGHVTVRARRDAGDVVVEVTDDGGGIDESERAKIWEPFWSGRAEGTGLGLALVRSIVERHEGRAEVDSAPGRGTTMRVAFPGEEPA
jgi:signal transduction histidine kinase